MSKINLIIIVSLILLFGAMESNAASIENTRDCGGVGFDGNQASGCEDTSYGGVPPVPPPTCYSDNYKTEVPCDGSGNKKSTTIDNSVDKPDRVDNGINGVPQLPVLNIKPSSDSGFGTFKLFDFGALKTKFLKWFRPQQKTITETTVNLVTKSPSPKKDTKKEYSNLRFGDYAINDEKSISSYSKGVIENILKDAKIDITAPIKITSTYRDAENQARIMFDNLERDRKKNLKTMNEESALNEATYKAKMLYCPNTYGTSYESKGCGIVDVYYFAQLSNNVQNIDLSPYKEYISDYNTATKDIIDDDAIKTSMAKRVTELGYTSNHMKNRDGKIQAIDIAPSSFSKDEKTRFETSVNQAISDGILTKDFFQPPKEDGYHIEVIQK